MFKWSIPLCILCPLGYAYVQLGKEYSTHKQAVVEEDSASESSDSGECESENDRVSKSGCERVFSSRGVISV